MILMANKRKCDVIFFVIEIGKPFHSEVGIGKGFNNIEIIKS
jgi:hypothetical protein